MAGQPPSYPIIDSHIHIYPSTELSTLAWCDPSHQLHSQQSLIEFNAATGRPKNLEGFIFIETDRKNDLTNPTASAGWEMPLKEVEWIKRVATGTPREGEGHVKEDAKSCLAIVPWAPLPLGVKDMEKWLEEVKKVTGPELFEKVRGFRYLVQDKPKGTMLKKEFIEALRWMGRKGYAFDLGVDQKGGGRWQLEEAVEMMEKAHEGLEEKEKVTVIINHLCKPDLAVYNPSDPTFIAWKSAIFTLGKCSNTYMKLSGCLVQLPDHLKNAPADEIFLALQPYLIVLLASFGPFRMMFGSDWPVCTVGVEDAWQKWKKVVERICYIASLSEEDQIMLWSGTAIKAYGIKELM